MNLQKIKRTQTMPREREHGLLGMCYTSRKKSVRFGADQKMVNGGL